METGETWHQLGSLLGSVPGLVPAAPPVQTMPQTDDRNVRVTPGDRSALRAA